jgi:hypothetical protein
MTSYERELWNALQALKNEASGCIQLEETALRELLGNTNVNCLRFRIDRAIEVLSKATND